MPAAAIAVVPTTTAPAAAVVPIIVSVVPVICKGWRKRRNRNRDGRACDENRLDETLHDHCPSSGFARRTLDAGNYAWLHYAQGSVLGKP